jgi:hypothetical protein
VTLLLAAQPPPITLSVGTGSVTLTWLGARVLYARLCGDFSLPLGRAQAARLGELTEHCTAIHYFADGSALEHYDLGVRNLFARFISARRATFASITLLACSRNVQRRVEPLVAATGGLVRLYTRPAEFERALLLRTSALS